MPDLWNTVSNNSFLREILDLFDRETYLVGGCLRDMLLGIKSADYDLVTFDDVWERSAELAARLGAHAFWLDRERQVARVAARDLPVHFDLAAGRTATIAGDLLLRDITINAVALDISSGEIIDPLDGIGDIMDGVVRAVSEKNLTDDPLRILRCLRFALIPGFDLHPATAGLVRRHAGLLPGVAAERLKQEMMVALSMEGGANLFALMDEHGLLEELFPEYEDMDQGHHHRWPLIHHAVIAARGMDELIPGAERYLPGIGDYFDEELESGITRAGILKFSAFLHDVGKPLARRETGDGTVHFWGHAAAGARLAEKICRRFKFSNRATKVTVGVVHNHMRLLEVVLQCGELDNRRMHCLLRECREFVPEILLQAITDADATGKQAGSPGSRECMAEAARAVWQYYKTTYREQMAHPLLDGHVITKSLGVDPGPAVGQMLAAVAEARAAGLVASREAALEYLRQNQ